MTHSPESSRRMLDMIVEAAVEEVERITGDRLLVRQPGIMDAHVRDRKRMRRQCEAFIAADDMIDKWQTAHDPRTLGTLLKILPPDVSTEITFRLVLAGLLPREAL